MKLLVDENLSPRLLRLLAIEHDGSLHVREVGLASATDDEIWRFARRHGLTIVSKDSDFHQRSLLFGQPPKVLWIRIGNCSTDEIFTVLRRHLGALLEFGADPEATLLTLSWPTP